jgi:hypothetical protein
MLGEVEALGQIDADGGARLPDLLGDLDGGQDTGTKTEPRHQGL